MGVVRAIGSVSSLVLQATMTACLSALSNNCPAAGFDKRKSSAVAATKPATLTGTIPAPLRTNADAGLTPPSPTVPAIKPEVIVIAKAGMGTCVAAGHSRSNTEA